MANNTFQMNADMNDVIEQLVLVNQNLVTMQQNTQQVAQSSQDAGKKQESWMSKAKDMAGSLIGNYNNIKGVITDILDVYNEAYKRQLQWNNLLSSAAYSKYSDQINNIANASGGLTDAYSNVASLQKLFASNVELDGQKLEKLTSIATLYANKMGVDVTEAMQRFSETIAEGTTSKLEDLGIYMDSEEAVLNYAIAHGIASKEIDETTKKQIILNELLKLQPENMKNNTNSVQQLTATTREFKQHIDELIVGLGDTAGQGLMWLFNENAKGSEYWGGKIYDLVHIFEEVPEVIKGDVVPSVFSITASVNSFADSIKKVQEELENLGKSGLMAFKFIMEENKEAVKKHSEALRQERIKAYSEQIAEEMKQWKESNQVKMESENYWTNYQIKQIEKVKKAKHDAILREVENDKKKVEYQIMAKARDENFKKEELKLERDLFAKKKETLKDFNDGRLVKMQLTSDELKDMSQSEISEKIKNEKEYYDAADRMANMGVQKAAQFSNMLINDVLLGEKEFRKEMIGDFVKGIGDQMVADGTFHIFAGLAKAWGGNPLGWKESQAGAVEAAVGVGMGAGAKLIGTSSSGSEGTSKSTASEDRNKFEAQKDSQMSVYLYPDEKHYLRSFNKSLAKVGGKK